MAIESPPSAQFLPSLFIVCCHPPTIVFFFLSILLHSPPRSQIAAIRPAPNSPLPLSLPLQLGHICSQIHFTIFPEALPCSQTLLECLCKESSSYRNLATICGLIQSHCRQQETLGFNCNPNPITAGFSSCKLLLNDTNKQVKLHQYYQKQVSNSGYLISGTLGLVQKTTHLLPERRSWKNRWQCLQQGTRKMRSPEERPIQVCRFWHISSF